MKVRFSSRLRRLVVAAGVGSALTVTGITGGAAIAGASTTASVSVAGQAPVVAGSGYLALGDSITFGYREDTTKPAPNYKDAASFVGFPEDVSAALGLHVANAACPGETSASFIKVTARSNGCEQPEPGGTVAYRKDFPLHVKYSGSQLTYAVKYLKAHPGVRVVSLMIGANDGFLCQETTKDGCLKELSALLPKIAKNVNKILTGIRSTAGYKGQLVLVSYYSLNYRVLLDNVESRAINSALEASAKHFDARIANGYEAFRNASVHSGGNPCTAGLLTQLTTGGCGVHPSVAGSDVLALAVERVLTK
jgi:lysophospholipase L1-like esterase